MGPRYVAGGPSLDKSTLIESASPGGDHFPLDGLRLAILMDFHSSASVAVMLNGRRVFGGSPVILHPPDGAVTAELLHDRDIWMMYYRPNGSTDQISGDALRSVLGDELEYGPVADYLEERLLAAGRNALRSVVRSDSGHTVVAVWTLG